MSAGLVGVQQPFVTETPPSLPPVQLSGGLTGPHEKWSHFRQWHRHQRAPALGVSEHLVLSKKQEEEGDRQQTTAGGTQSRQAWARRSQHRTRPRGAG